MVLLVPINMTVVIVSDREWSPTHRGAAHEDDNEGAQDTPDAHHPGHSEEEDDPKDVLDAGQVHTHQGAQLWCLGGNKCI